MSNDSKPLPTNNKIRRRSIFDEQDNSQDKNESSISSFPTEKDELYYPIEYIENVRREIELWKMHLTKTLEEKNKFKIEKMELKKTTVDENILSPQQCEIITSFNFEDYVRKVQHFCDQAVIIAHKHQYKSENELKKKYLIIQQKLEKQILSDHFIDSVSQYQVK